MKERQFGTVDRVVNYLILGGAAAGLVLMRMVGVTAFHFTVEVFLLVMSIAIFIITLNLRTVIQEEFLLLIGSGYLAVGVLEFLHMLALPGMVVFPGEGPDLDTKFWVGARIMGSLTMLVAGLRVGRRVPYYPSLLAVVLLAGVIVASITRGWFPACHAEGVAYTPFRYAMEGAICVTYALAAAFFYVKRAELDREVLQWLMVSLVLRICAEAPIVFVNAHAGKVEMAGHVLMVVSFYFMYKAILQTALVDPHRVLFRNLAMTREALLRANAALERTLSARTAELEKAGATRWDIQEEAERQANLRSRKHALEAMEGKARAVAGLARVAHVSLGRDLAAIGGLARKGMKAAGGGTGDRAHLKAILERSRASDRVSGLLGILGEMEEMKAAETDLDALITSMEKKLEEAAGSASLKMSPSFGTWKVAADGKLLGRALEWLVRMCATRMGGEGNLRMTEANVTVDERTAHDHPGVARGRYAAIQVSDTGKGLDEAALSSLFDPVPEGAGAGPGSLEYAAAYAVFTRMGGHVTVLSSPGSGYVMSVYLPATDAR